MSAIDAKTGVIYEDGAAIMEEVTRLADIRQPACPHGLRVPCRKCEPPRRRNTWSDEREPPARAPELEEPPT